MQIDPRQISISKKSERGRTWNLIHHGKKIINRLSTSHVPKYLTELIFKVVRRHEDELETLREQLSSCQRQIDNLQKQLEGLTVNVITELPEENVDWDINS